MIIVLLMLTSALAGCTGTDTTDLEQQIADLQQSNDEMSETINQQNEDIADAETYRDSLLALLEGSNTSNDELESMIETANNTILTLQSDLAVQQDLVAQWQQTAEDNRADLSYAELSEVFLIEADLSGANLSHANLYHADLSHADLTGANLIGAALSDVDLYGVYWGDTTCPDGTNSDDNGDTCEYNL